MNGILIIDKPSGVTSFDVVRRIKRISGAKKVGHGGTLDPLATGVLPILIGSATKLSMQVMEGEKEYIAGIKFGVTTDTDDAQGVILDSKTPPDDLLDRVKMAIPKFLGIIQQLPPIYSAIKQNGQPAYKKARKGEKVEVAPRQVEIKEIDVVEAGRDVVSIRVKCSKGTYIRSLARDLGAEIGCGAHIISLRRTICGAYSINDAEKLDEISSLQDIERMLGVRL